MKEFTIYELTPRIYMVEFDDPYKLSMTFFRYQEFYESPNDLIKGKPLSFLKNMELYSKDTKDKDFSYASDWGGFNVPSKVIEDLLAFGIVDHNEYDYRMLAIHTLIRSKTSKPYYLIGVPKNEKQYADHEIAHGLFHTVKSYRETMTRIVNGLPKKLYDRSMQILLSGGYCKEVLVDEVQAYLATGPDPEFDIFFTNWQKEPFIEIFQRYKNRNVNKESVIIA